MRKLAIFGEAFLDGFTMTGLRGRTSPAAVDSLLAPEDQNAHAQVVSFTVSEPSTGRVQVRGDLHQLPLGALDTMMMVITAERNSRVSEDAAVSGSNV